MGKTQASIARCRICGSQALSKAISVEGSAGEAASDPISYVVCDVRRNPDGCGAVQAEHADGRARPLAPVAHVGAAAARRTARAARAVSRSVGGNVLEIAGDAFASGWWKTSASDDLGETRIHRADRSDLKDAGTNNFDLIVSQHVLESADAPLSHARAVSRLLADDGVWIVETAYAPAAVAQARADHFRRPVRTVYGLAALERLASRAKLKIVRAALIDDARTLRAALVRRDCTVWRDPAALAALADLWDAEAALNLDHAAPYEALQERWADIAADTRDAIKRAPGPCALWSDTAPARAYVRRLGLDDLIDWYAEEPASLLAQTPGDERRALETLSDFISTGGSCVLSGTRTQLVTAEGYPMALARALAETSAPGELATLQALLRAAGRPRVIRDAAQSLGA